MKDAIQIGDENRCFTLLVFGEQEVLCVWRPGELFHPVVQRGGKQILDLLRLSVVKHQPEAVALIAGAGLRAPGQITAVGRVGGIEVAA